MEARKGRFPASNSWFQSLLGFQLSPLSFGYIDANHTIRIRQSVNLFQGGSELAGESDSAPAQGGFPAPRSAL
jgi:hypothetical protein